MRQTDWKTLRFREFLWRDDSGAEVASGHLVGLVQVEEREDGGGDVA
jgi:hypothetical protein